MIDPQGASTLALGAPAARLKLDREHYVQKQLRPVAEPVLEALQLEFEQVIGDDRQIALF